MKKVFVVDDEKDVLILYKKYLELAGFSVIDTATNGKEALDKLSKIEEKPDLIIMDYKMPIMNGIVATRKIKKLYPNSKIIMVSADSSIRDEAILCGVLGFVKKNSSFKHLISKILSLLD
ncbi:MAG: response regulator transcription factor [Candidatus Lokiarchaeota archaeon]